MYGGGGGGASRSIWCGAGRGVILCEVAIGPGVLIRINPNLVVRVRVRVGLLGKSFFPVGRVKNQRLLAGPIATALYYVRTCYM